MRVGSALMMGTWTQSMTGDGVRGPTSLTFDAPRSLTRIVVGDVGASTGLLGGGAFIGGFNISREYSLDPYFIRYATPSLPGLAATAATVDVYVNDQLIRRERIPAGPFEIQGLPLQNGRGMARMVIRDVLGREHHVAAPYYLSTSMLAQGLHEFS